MNTSTSNQEIEVRFLEVDKESLIKKLNDLGAQNRGEDTLEEIIFYDKEQTWKDKFVRLRKTKDLITMTYKHHKSETVEGAEEIEFCVSDIIKAEEFLEKIGLVAFRHQQKKRHTFFLNEVIVDIDTWPKIPTYVELEGGSESLIKKVAHELNLNWEDAIFENARTVIEKRYKIPVGSMKWFTFDRFE